jgi:cytochrome P450 PksS
MRFRLRGLRGPHTEAAVHLIGNGMLALIEHPAELERLRAHPELLDGALEELLRFTSPQLLSTPRTAMEDVVLEGVPLPRGSVVRGLLASANRDRGAFRDADDLDLARRAGRPVVGAHVSPSLAFARRVAKVGLRALLRYPDIRLVGHPSLVKWRRSAELRGLRSLPLYLGGRARKEAQRAA